MHSCCSTHTPCKYLHTPVISYLPLAPVPFLPRYFLVTRLNANFSFPKHLGHSLQKSPFLQSDLVLYPGPHILWHLCVVSAVELCLEFGKAGKRRWSQFVEGRGHPAHLGFCLPELFLHFPGSTNIKAILFQAWRVTDSSPLSCCCPDDSVCSASFISLSKRKGD